VVLVERVCARLRDLGATSIRTLEGVREQVIFKLPTELTRSGLGSGSHERQR
jgi:hypothetical protein